MSEIDKDSNKRRSFVRKSLPALIGLAAGIAGGAAVWTSGRSDLMAAVGVVESIGNLWINAILMTIIPLIVSSLFVGVVTTASNRVIGRIGWRAVVLFLLLLVGGAIITALIAPALLAGLPIDEATSASLRAAAGSAATSSAPPPSFAQWIVALVPTNPIKAAAEGAILPLIVFTLVFAFAATRISADLREYLLRFSQAVSEAIQVLLGWVVWFAPAGIFALSLAFAARTGPAVAGALGYYIAVTSAVVVALTACLYLVAVAGGRVSFRRFAEACIPAQIVAFSSHSSLASLPAMIKGARERLNLSSNMTAFVLPLAVSTFKFSGPIWYVLVVFFISRLYSIPISSPRLIATIVTAVLTSFTVAGVPSGAIYVILPVLIAAGLPLEVTGLLLAVDAIPNSFRTMSNVTGNLTAAVVLSRYDSQSVVSNEAPISTEAAIAPTPELNSPLGGVD